MIILEKLNFFFILKFFFIKNKSRFSKKIYFIDIDTKFTSIYKLIFSIFGKFEIIKLNFSLINIREKNGELTKLKIYRKELFKIEKFLSDNNKLNQFITKNKLNHKYITKSIIHEFFYGDPSLPKTIYLLNVINQMFQNKNNLVILNNRFYKKLYYFYLLDKNIKNIEICFLNNISLRLKLKNILVFFIKFYKILLISKKNNKLSNLKLYCIGENNTNLFNPNQRSDFFYTFNTNFPYSKILYNISKSEDLNNLENHINITMNFKTIYTTNTYIKNSLNYNIFNFLSLNYDLDYIINKSQIYFWNKFRYLNYFKNHNIKLTFNWYKYDQNQFLINECMDELGGISSIWQMAFDGTPMYDCKTSADISFLNSNFSFKTQQQTQSECKFNVITGLSYNYINDETKKNAFKIRKQLKSLGVKKVICVLDENSINDDRWHTGNEIQKENYSLILEELLKNKELGLIFKPKVSFSLRERIGDVNIILEEGKKTGRVIVFDDDKNILDKKSSSLPIHAALSSDLVVHSHLSAGTAAIESALYGIPTVLIDREQSLDSKLNQLPKNKVVFDNWKNFIEIMNSDFLKNDNNEIGLWGKFINEFDPFNDKKGHIRIGHYLKEILQLYDKGYKKNDILEQVSENYKKRWGNDKIIIK